MPHLAEELALLLEALHDALGGRVPGLEEDGVENLSGTEELVALGLVDGAIGANAEGVVFALDKRDSTEAKAATDALGHAETVKRVVFHRQWLY